MEEEYKRFQFSYGILMVRTRRFTGIMERLGRYKVSKATGWALLYLLPVAAGLGLLLFILPLGVLFSARAHDVGAFTRTISPLAYLGLPGINPYLPIVDGWLALIFAMIVHEGAHGIVARGLGFPVKSSGLLFLLVVPIGAFVEVDEEALKVAKARDSGRVLAAGAGVNFVVALIFLSGLLGVVSTMAPAAHGIAVTQVSVPSPASSAFIRPGDFILSVNGTSYDSQAQLRNGTWYHPGSKVVATIYSQGEERNVSVVVGARPDAAVACAKNGTAYECVGTLSGYMGTVGGESLAFQATGAGTFTSQKCAIVVDSCGVSYSPVAGMPAQNITVAYLGDSMNAPAIGVAALGAPSTASQSTPSPMAALSPTGYLGIGAEDYSSLVNRVSQYSGGFLSKPSTYSAYMCIPTYPRCQGIAPFSDQYATFYKSSAYGGSVIGISNLLYWFFFLNFNLAIFNALPIYPLDGGQAFRAGLKGLAGQKLSDKWLMRVVGVVTLAVVMVILSFPLAAYLNLV